MFTFDTTIDTIQTTKKAIVSTFVTNQKIADSLNSFVDAQTRYTKDAVKVSTDTATTIGRETLNYIQEAMKFDWTKAYAKK